MYYEGLNFNPFNVKISHYNNRVECENIPKEGWAILYTIVSLNINSLIFIT